MKRILYLGTQPTSYTTEGHVLPYPVIRIVPRPIPEHILADILEYTHVIFTSKNAVTTFFEAVDRDCLKGKILIAIGQSTAARLKTYGYEPTYIAEEESQEGVIALLRTMDLEDAYVFMPRSSLARKNLESFLQEREIRYQVCDLYDTVPQKLEPIPDLDAIDEIVFTSPSTVRAFVEIFTHIPRDKTLTCLGPITQEELHKEIL